MSKYQNKEHLNQKDGGGRKTVYNYKLNEKFITRVTDFTEKGYEKTEDGFLKHGETTKYVWEEKPVKKRKYIYVDTFKIIKKKIPKK